VEDGPPARKPLAGHLRHPGEVHSHFWSIPNVRKTGEFPHLLVDVNYWRTFVHVGLATTAGDRGCISLFGKDSREHELFAEHVAHSETYGGKTDGRGPDCAKDVGPRG